MIAGKIRMRWLRATVATLAVTAASMTVFARGKGTPGESCTDDDYCRRGHCYQREDKSRVCVDCEPRVIRETRALNAEFCKSKQRPRKCEPRTDIEVADTYFRERIHNATQCLKARDTENAECWAGGDDGHDEDSTIYTESERARVKCHDIWTKKKEDGFIYTCSESSFTKLQDEAEAACKHAEGCGEWKFDKEPADCAVIARSMAPLDDCSRARLQMRQCLPKFSRTRRRALEDLEEAHLYCDEVLKYKKKYDACL